MSLNTSIIKAVVADCSYINYCMSSGKSEYLVPGGRPGMTLNSSRFMFLFRCISICFLWISCYSRKIRTGFTWSTRLFTPTNVPKNIEPSEVPQMSR